jgi:hypothetical protein
VSNEAVRELVYEGTGGQLVTSSLTGSGFDLSLYRIRAGADSRE